MTISPKVYLPVVLQLLAGIALLLLGYDVEGKTAIAAAIGTFAVGYQAKDPERGASGAEVLLALIACELALALAVGWNL